jgi:TolB-like protein/DNA-binding SARP family transcriptional activator/Flp pilus assembly protein TadD
VPGSPIHRGILAAPLFRPPFRLVTLGRLALVDADGREEPSLAKRPRKLAVLAWIALAGRRTSRERLVGVFWGERDEDRARNSLSDALSHLRRVLGHAALPAYQDQIGIAEDFPLAVDVVELKDAARAGDHARVIDLYSGPFLDGVFIGEAPEFEHWSDEVRATTDALFVRSCQVRCNELAQSGDSLACELLARRWLRTDPASGEAALLLLNSLAAAGTHSARVTAMREFAALTARLRRDYGVAPDPAVAERAREIGEGMDVVEMSDVDPAGTSPTAPAPRNIQVLIRRPAAAITAMLALFVIVTIAATRGSWRIPDATATSETAGNANVAHPHSVGVLRFQNIGGAAANQYFSDGMAEEIIQALARLEGVQVVGRSASFPLSSDSLRPDEVARRLSVANLLEGSVRRSGDSLRIAVRLINANGHTLWQETYDRAVRDAFAVQDAVARGVAAVLLGQQDRGEASARPPRTQTDFETYDLYLRGRYAWWNAHSETAVRQSIAYFRRAIARDSSFAPAWVGLADAFLELTSFHDVAPSDAVPVARAALQRARALDPGLADVHASSGYLATFHDWRWTEAEAHFRRALSLDARHSNARLWYAWMLSARGQHEDAVQRIREAQAHQPFSQLLNVRFATMLYFARDFEAAARHARAAIAADSTYWLPHRQLGEALVANGKSAEAVSYMRRAATIAPSSENRARLAYTLARNGNEEAARAILTELSAAGSTSFVNPIELARVHVGLGDIGRALQLLEQGVAAGASIAIMLNVEPAFDPLRKEPRFQALIRRLGL